MLENNDKKGMPTLQEAEAFLYEAGELNPGPWVKHSMYVSKAAQMIAENCEGLDPYIASILGMIHDIGRRFGITGMRHILDGYNFLMEKGFYKVAKVCITHSFDCKDIKSAFGKWDCTKEEYEFVKQYLESNEYDDYDRLIQLCDSLAFTDGYCLIEKRMIDVALRHGINEYTTLKWKATFEIKEYFELKMGKSVYSVLPGVVENTFGL
ncbi:HD domain-containing protein [Clostridium beijerinckii]|uniref:HD domain-containing protein n=1 Tax=Clostridium beijerinckii TaxID=1520 RepID=A0AAW3WG30_CLOBE|nr:HD domain-containing protein [Clostridium beijerinckii]MBC2460322.1 HD domain-containing protein [Clostridium beijerinckii]MBC2477814.1 HD domain-containing protein [Clostridium beijerinckii]NOV59031.1 HD superfamily phosphodiesterase [Clostridium beijerinckii]NOV71581.1 HD superfamily phosphodiesterase [Clostridium beijerinckii]NOW32386.1 HD superfamily phosphodiesterase [Clostridium beijerinckii]